MEDIFLPMFEKWLFVYSPWLQRQRPVAIQHSLRNCVDRLAALYHAFASMQYHELKLDSNIGNSIVMGYWRDNELDFELIIFFWTSSQLSVWFRSCRLLHLICEFANLPQWNFLHPLKLYILFAFGSHNIQLSKVANKPAFLCVMSSKLRTLCDFHW